MNTMFEDVSSEGGQPNETVWVDGLDETALGRAWESGQKSMSYGFLYHNCATMIATMLFAAGGTLSHASNSCFMNQVLWTPGAVIDFGKCINQNIGEIKKRLALTGPPLLSYVFADNFRARGPEITKRGAATAP